MGRGAEVLTPQVRHTLIRGQSVDALDAAILHFEDDAGGGVRLQEPRGTLAPHLQAAVLRAASRTVRVVTTYNDHKGAPLPALTAEGTGLRVGNRILTAFTNIRFKVETHEDVGTRHRIHVRGGTVAPWRPSQLATWGTAACDVDAGQHMADAAGRIVVARRDGILWSRCERVDLAVLEAERSDPQAGAGLGRDDFAAATAAALHEGEEHVVVGYPGVVPPSSADRLWHGTGQMTDQRLSDVFQGYQRRIASRAQQQALAPPQPLYIPQSGSPHCGTPLYHLHGHSAHALRGMAGGPVLNSAGRIVGLHVGGADFHRGAYNLYLGVDHPSLQAAIARCCGQE